MAAAIPIAAAVIGAGGSYMASREQRKGTEAAMGSIYQPPFMDRMADVTRERIMGGMTAPPLEFFSQYPALSEQMVGQAQQVGAPGSPYQQYLEQYLQGAFDPQRDPAYNQMMQGVRGATSARGLTASPYGAGLEGLAAQQWGMNERERQTQALQQYMSGQQGMQGLGANALQSAVGLQQAKHQWNLPFIQQGLGYIGQGVTAGGQMAGLQQQIGQQNAAPWAQVGQAGMDLAGSLLQHRLTTPPKP